MVLLNVENELVILLYSKCDDEAKEMKSCVRYWDIVQPAQSNPDGLVASLCEAMKSLGIEDVTDGAVVLATASKLPLLIGGGASVNVGIHNGMKQKMQSIIPWLFWSWCFSYRLELACKGAFTSTKKLRKCSMPVLYLPKIC